MGEHLSQAASPARILLLVPGFAGSEDDTTCIPALQTYVRSILRRAGEVSLEIIAFQYPFRYRHYRWNGQRVISCGGRNRGKLGRLRTWRRAMRGAAELHHQAPFDLVHSFWLEECSLIGQRLALRWSIPQIATIMGQDALPANRYLARLNLDQMRITAGSATVAGEFSRHTGHPVDQIIPLGLDTESFPALEPERTRDIDILGVGALTELKNFGCFVEVVAALKPDFPALRCLIIGDGPQRSILQRQIDSSGLGQNVLLTGKLTRAEVLERMARSRMVLHPSRYESQGYVLMEALYSGARVVCGPVGIARHNEQMQVCGSLQEMIAATRRTLEHHGQGQRVLLLPAQNTAAQYLSLYRSPETQPDPL